MVPLLRALSLPAALAGSVSSGTCPLTLPTVLYLVFPLSGCGEVGCFFFAFFTSAWTCLLARSLLILCVIKKSMFNDMD